MNILDLDEIRAIEAYNARRHSNSPMRLQVHLGPETNAANPATANVLLLMNNPGFDPLTSTPADHSVQFSGWPLSN